MHEPACDAGLSRCSPELCLPERAVSVFHSDNYRAGPGTHLRAIAPRKATSWDSVVLVFSLLRLDFPLSFQAVGESEYWPHVAHFGSKKQHTLGPHGTKNHFFCSAAASGFRTFYVENAASLSLRLAVQPIENT